MNEFSIYVKLLYLRNNIMPLDSTVVHMTRGIGRYKIYQNVVFVVSISKNYKPAFYFTS